MREHIIEQFLDNPEPLLREAKDRLLFMAPELHHFLLTAVYTFDGDVRIQVSGSSNPDILLIAVRESIVRALEATKPSGPDADEIEGFLDPLVRQEIIELLESTLKKFNKLMKPDPKQSRKRDRRQELQ